MITGPERKLPEESISCGIPIDLCPMYLKEGTMIPMYEKMAYVGEKPYRTLYLLTTPGEASYDHFQDNGEDYAYRKGVYNLYHFHKNAQGVLETEMRHKNYPNTSRYA